MTDPSGLTKVVEPVAAVLGVVTEGEGEAVIVQQRPLFGQDVIGAMAVVPPEQGETIESVHAPVVPPLDKQLAPTATKELDKKLPPKIKTTIAA